MVDQKKKILVADDNPNLRVIVEATLGSSEFEVRHAGDGDEALENALRHRPDLVLLDIKMPGLDGFEVCRRLKADPVAADTKVIMLTGLGDEFSIQTAREIGADGYFVKPFSPLALLNMVYSLLGPKTS